MNTADTLLGRTPVVILAGGLGTRLRPVLTDLPKGLAPVGDEPFLQVQIEMLRGQGAREFVLCVGHLAGHIRDHLGDGTKWAVRIRYSADGERRLGTGGALKRAERYFTPRAVALNGDTYLAVSFERLLEHHLRARGDAGAMATLSLARAPDAGRYGTVLLDAGGQYVTGFREKEAATDGARRWLNAGAYVIERDLLDLMEPDAPASLECDVLPRVLAAGHRIAAFRCAGPFYDIGTPADLARFTDHYKDVRNGRSQPADGG
jgi:NDP-sugar pyrophosphorylase family protein